MDDGRVRARHLEHEGGQLGDGALVGAADVDRTGHARVEQGDQPGHLVVDVAQAPGLGPVAVHGERPSLDGLGQEVRDHPPVAGAEPGPVGVEDADDAGVDTSAPPVGGRERFAEALGLVVNTARTDWVDVPPVGLDLWMDEWVTVDLARRR